MWYKILVENEIADYFINNDIFTQNDAEIQKTEELLYEYTSIVNGVTMAWSFYNSKKKNEIAESLAKESPRSKHAFNYCCDRIRFSEAKNLGDIYRSIPIDADLELLSAEQCAVKIIYPFLSRMDGSYEKEFFMSGNFKKYLLVLKDKCAKN